MDEEKYETQEDKNLDISENTAKKFGVGLFLCLLAVIIGSAIAVGAGKKFTQNIELESSVVSTTDMPTTTPSAEDMTQKAAADVTGVPDERTKKEESTTGNPSEKFIFPLTNNIIKDYSDNVAVKSNTLGDWRVHNGIDFTAKTGDTVKAVKSGSVNAVYIDKLWGTVVEIDHGDSIVAKYCGLKDGTTPSVGDVLQQGETVGTVGLIPSEAADEPHLHFEMTVSGKTADPIEVMGIG